MNGPPQRESRPTGGRAASSSAERAAHSSGYPRQLRLRRAASQRLPPLEHLGRSDPWHYPPPGERGYEDAAEHLLDHGLTPGANREGLRLMWKRGGHSRQAAEVIADAWGLVA